MTAGYDAVLFDLDSVVTWHSRSQPCERLRAA